MATANDIVRTAVAEIGVTEYPPSSNNVKYNTEYYGQEVYGDDAYPWCMAFVWWVFKHANASGLFYEGSRTASCPTLARWAQRIGRWVTSDYHPGDVIIYDFDKYDEWPYEHTGILERVEDGVYYVIEGNTSTSSNDNGGAVMRRARYKSQIAGAYRPPYTEEVYEEDIEVEEDEDMTLERFSELMQEYRKQLQDNECGAWSQGDRDWAISTGLIKGSDPLPDGSPNYMWADFLTREQAVALMHRLAKITGAE